ncbi:MAG: hypothetical protein FRX49_04164 [Trebouxia sp. A1-2]|nr:MAG: hypothetical protein FRX49_04164 [Trebouxia sp. A1-2]
MDAKGLVTCTRADLIQHCVGDLEGCELMEVGSKEGGAADRFHEAGKRGETPQKTKRNRKKGKKKEQGENKGRTEQASRRMKRPMSYKDKLYLPWLPTSASTSLKAMTPVSQKADLSVSE